jgi:class 3 adenylate cyclase
MKTPGRLTLLSSGYLSRVGWSRIKQHLFKLCQKRSCRQAPNRPSHQSQPLIEFGVGLNVGEVVYGNVGAPDRLDFTVMGPAVNRTARLESLTRKLGQHVLLSKDFSDQIDCNTMSLGLHKIKCIKQPQSVFAVGYISEDT